MDFYQAARMADYDSALAKNVPRQLARLRYNITPDAYDQLCVAFIFHWKHALSTLWWGVRHVLTLRCSTCGYQHFFRPFRRRPRGSIEIGPAKEWDSGYYMGCGYGWWKSLKMLPTYWLLMGKHGKD